MSIVCFLTGLGLCILLPAILFATLKLPKQYEHLEKGLKEIEVSWSLTGEMECRRIVHSIKETRILIVLGFIILTVFSISALGVYYDYFIGNDKPTYTNTTFSFDEDSNVLTMTESNCTKFRFNPDRCKKISSKSIIVTPNIFKEIEE